MKRFLDKNLYKNYIYLQQGLTTSSERFSFEIPATVIYIQEEIQKNQSNPTVY